VPIMPGQFAVRQSNVTLGLQPVWRTIQTRRRAGSGKSFC
jgi:hypothetical protein